MLPTSIGHKWQKGGRNAPTVLNAVFNVAQFWDGRAADLKAQAGGPIQNPIEMGITHEHAIEMLKGIPGYTPLFGAAYPDDKDPITMTNVVTAIAAFEATLITPNAPFDKYLKGDESALTPEQKEGLKLFVDTGCASCHSGINIGGQMYAPFGVVERPGADILPPNDKGRFAVTKTVSDEYVFRVPPLRNIELTPPYFHSGQVWDLNQAVGIMATDQLGKSLNDEHNGRATAGHVRDHAAERGDYANAGTIAFEALWGLGPACDPSGPTQPWKQIDQSSRSRSFEDILRG